MRNFKYKLPPASPATTAQTMAQAVVVECVKLRIDIEALAAILTEKGVFTADEWLASRNEAATKIDSEVLARLGIKVTVPES